jgi:hypothetical protein
MQLERAKVRKYWHDFTTLQFYSIFILFIKILFAIHLKHFSFWPTATVKLMSNDIVHTMPWLCMYAHMLFLCIYYDLYGRCNEIYLEEMYFNSLFQHQQNVNNNNIFIGTSVSS